MPGKHPDYPEQAKGASRSAKKVERLMAKLKLASHKTPNVQDNPLRKNSFLRDEKRCITALAE
ncbi:MAG: hypothetical protein WC668_00065 [Patescibacteria group bacterium]|jgi:hypothetical protein